MKNIWYVNFQLWLLLNNSSYYFRALFPLASVEKLLEIMNNKNDGKFPSNHTKPNIAFLNVILPKQIPK